MIVRGDDDGYNQNPIVRVHASGDDLKMGHVPRPVLTPLLRTMLQKCHIHTRNTRDGSNG